MLTSRFDYLLFSEGLFLVAVAVVAELLRRKGEAGPWGSLSLFGLAAGLAQWLGLIPVGATSIATLQTARGVLVLAAFGTLLLRSGRTVGGGEKRSARTMALLLSLPAFGAVWPFLGVRVAASVVVVGWGLGGAAGLWRAVRSRRGLPGLVLSLALYTFASSIAFSFGDLFAPVSRGLTGPPWLPMAVLLKTAVAALVACAVWRYARGLHSSEQAAQRAAVLGHRFPAWIGVALGLALVGGYVLSERLGQFSREALTRDGGDLARAISHELGGELLKDENAFLALAGSPVLERALRTGRGEDLKAAQGLLHSYLESFTGRTYFLVSPSGEVILEAPEGAVGAPGTFAFHPLLPRIKGGRIGWSFGSEVGRADASLWFAYPVAGSERGLVGMLFVEKSIGRVLANFGQELVFLVDEQGRVVRASSRGAQLLPGAGEERAGADVVPWNPGEAPRSGDELSFRGEKYVSSRADLEPGLSLILLKSAAPVQAYRLFGVLFSLVACGLILGLLLHSELKRESAEAIAASEDRLRRIFESAPDGIVVFDAETGQIQLVNPPFARWLGYSEDELPGKSVTKWSMEVVREQSAGGFQPGKTFRFGDDHLRKRDGTAVSIEATGTFAHFHGRRCVVAFVRDTTERKRAEEALRAQQALLLEEKEFSENLLRSSAVAAFVLGPDHRVLFWNSACEELTHLPAREVVGTNLHWKAFYAEERPCLADFVIDGRKPRGLAELYADYGPSKLLANGLHAQRWFRNLGGEDRYIVFDAAPIRNSRGELVGVIETLQDITDRKRAEEERALLAAAIEQAAEIIVIADAAGRIRYANPVFADVTGYSVSELAGADHRIWEGTGRDAPTRLEIAEALKAGQVWAGRLVNRRKDGSYYEEDATIAPVRDSGGEITHFVGVSRDVSKEVQLERQLAQAQKFEALGTLAGGIAHDFNNILAVIIGYTEMALDDAPSGGVTRRSLEHVLSASERARDLVRQILVFSRRSEPVAKPTRVAEIVEETVQFCRASLPPNVEIRKNILAHESFVASEATQLHQVLLNLCANAGQAMEEKGGVLTVSLEDVTLEGDGCVDLLPGSYVRLEVSDTGCGIEAPVLERIFEPFFTTKDVGRGTGMGLAVVHGIVRSVGGDIEVHSRRGEGTTFTVYLPVIPAEQEFAESASETRLVGGTERVLFVEDEPVLVELGEKMLTQLGYRVTVASRGDEALRCFLDTPDAFDLVITDQGLPGLRGIELARSAHQVRPEMPILLCTGYSTADDTKAAREAGIREVLSKPVAVRELARAVRTALSTQEPLQEEQRDAGTAWQPGSDGMRSLG